MKNKRIIPSTPRVNVVVDLGSIFPFFSAGLLSVAELAKVSYRFTHFFPRWNKAIDKNRACHIVPDLELYVTNWGDFSLFAPSIGTSRD